MAGARQSARIRSFMFSGWGKLQGCAAGESGGYSYFCLRGEATKHNRWALCDIALLFVENWPVNRRVALSFPLERWTKGERAVHFPLVSLFTISF